MKLSDHLQNEELERIKNAWKYLTPFQRKVFRFRIAVGSLGRRSLNALDQHIHRRRASFAYFYPAHWISK